jgi:hypothetical protein
MRASLVGILSWIDENGLQLEAVSNTLLHISDLVSGYARTRAIRKARPIHLNTFTADEDARFNRYGHPV